MSDNPEEILGEAGIECSELSAYHRIAPRFLAPEDYYPGKDALVALARLVAKYKWLYTNGVEFGLTCMQDDWNQRDVDRIMAREEAGWEKAHHDE